MAAELWVAHLGLVPYREGVQLQERLRLLEHPPVYTKGRRTEPGDLPMGEEWYRLQGIEVEETDRGGRVTYHGPGQLVGYPIMQVSDVPAYVQAMERAICDALAEENVEARTLEGETGVWSGEPPAKIASIGVHVSRGVTTHGFAINVDNDLQPFEWVVPCGLAGVRMTSLCKETGRADQLRCFRRRMAYCFAQAVERRQRLVSRERLQQGELVAA
jgi:lipoyl(octanoyl) transferase